ncbi:hypothetical protein OIU77_020443 [Salix suchowensis]|uniref:Uncharacterized protein n=1 Tax=Salix suchowensis TaxID=1278906 RepID=A0ABQ9C6H9_9ROSI|nr:hypothetical protein OIU77_020443 [Salix suchowensis]
MDGDEVVYKDYSFPESWIHGRIGHVQAIILLIRVYQSCPGILSCGFRVSAPSRDSSFMECQQSPIRGTSLERAVGGMEALQNFPASTKVERSMSGC